MPTLQTEARYNSSILNIVLQKKRTLEGASLRSQYSEVCKN
jgi:hypothetical protein